MLKNNIRIVKPNFLLSTTASGYDRTHSYMHGYNLDLSRETAVLMRQSRKGADESNVESRLLQEGLARTAVEIRGDNDINMIIECDEGSGISGQKKIYERPKLLQLWDAILAGTVGSVIVAREDRLFRDRFLTQVTQFVQECANRGVLVIIAGRRCYDFRVQDDFNAFIRKMQEAYAYIDNHVRYMYEVKLQKLQRGEWVGGGLAAPYVLDRAAIQYAREQRKALKELGIYESDEQLSTQSFRPIIYEPWRPIALDLFQKFKLFDFSTARLGRYIEEKKCVFPIPEASDLQKYIFRANMKLIPNLGYTFGDTAVMPKWLTNLAHIGFASAGKDEENHKVYIENAFEGAIPRDLFEECYQAINGYTVNGDEGIMAPHRRRYVRKYPTGKSEALLTNCFNSQDDTIRFSCRNVAGNGKSYYFCYARTRLNDEGQVSFWDSNVLWTMSVNAFDHGIVNRLTELAEYDKELASRVEEYYTELNKGRTGEKESIVQDIKAMRAMVVRYDQLLTNPAQPLTASQEKRFLEAQTIAERDLDKAEASLKKYEGAQPEQFIPAFYRILGEAPGEFWQMDIDRQRKMLRLLVDDIQIESISPHLYSLRLKWKDPVAQRWDCAIIYRRQGLRSALKGESWSEEEDQIIRQMYPTTDKMDLLRAFSTRTGMAIKCRAADLQVKRDLRGKAAASIMHRSLCYNDWMQACKVLGVENETEEGRQVLERLNYYAQTTEQSQYIAFWWLLPIVDMNDFEQTLSLHGLDTSFLSAQGELHHRRK